MIPKRQMQLKTTAFEITYLVLNAAHIFVYLYICIILSPVLTTINNSGAAAVCHSKVGRNYSSTKLCLHSSLVKYVTSGWYRHTGTIDNYLSRRGWHLDLWWEQWCAIAWNMGIADNRNTKVFVHRRGSHKVTNGHVTHLRLVCKEGGEGGCHMLASPKYCQQYLEYKQVASSIVNNTLRARALTGTPYGAGSCLWCSTPSSASPAVSKLAPTTRNTPIMC